MSTVQDRTRPSDVSDAVADPVADPAVTAEPTPSNGTVPPAAPAPEVVESDDSGPESDDSDDSESDDPDAGSADPGAQPDAGRPRTRVQVSHGDLRYARHHVLVGHHPGGSLVAAEAALDQLLDGRLSRAALLGIYPGALETCQIFTDATEWSSPPGAIVLGLGPIGQLTAASLSRGVVHATLAAALSHLSGSQSQGAWPAPERIEQMQLSSLLIGAGADGISVRDCVQAVLTGVRRANERLRDTRLPVHVADVEFLELWQDRALQAIEALDACMSSGELGEVFEVEPRLREMPGRQRRLHYAEPSGWWQQVQVRSEPDGSLTFGTSVRGAGAPIRTVATQRALVDRLVESLVDSPTPDPSAARTLYELLFPNDFKVQAPDADNYVLIVDEGSAHYPWEMLDDQDSDLNRTPLGVRRGLIRQLEGSAMRSHVLSATNSRALVVGDTASGLTPLIEAQREAVAVAAALRDKGFTAQPLIAGTGTQVVQALFEGSYRVIHLAAHGVYRWPLDAPAHEPAAAGPTDGELVTGVVLGNGMYLTAGEIGQMRQVPDLVVVNCCHLGATAQAAGTPARSGNFHRLAASFAMELIEIGVRAVVACGWAVSDAAAATFAETLYGALLSGATFGEAVGQARYTTWDEHRDVNTWGAYQCYGDPEFRLVHDGPTVTETAPGAPASLDVTRQAIENLEQSVDVSRDTKYGLERLRELQAQLQPEDLADGSMQVVLARAYNRLGSFEAARSLFEGALKGGGAALTVRDFEVWLDQGVRGAASKATTADAIDTAVRTIESTIDTLRRLLVDPTVVVGGGAPAAAALPDPKAVPAGVSVDRLWRVASAYKRLAMVTRPIRDPAAGAAAWARSRDALVNMADWYDAARAVAEATASASASRRLGALSNWLAAEAALTRHGGKERPPIDPERARSLITTGLKKSAREAHLAPNFWTIAVYADLSVLKTLFSAAPASRSLPTVLDLYRRASELGSEEQFRQVCEQVAFLAALAVPQSGAVVDFLTDVAQGLAEIDARARPGT